MIKKVLSVITLALVAFIAYQAFTGEVELNGQMMPMWDALVYSFQHLNPWILLLLIPEQILMYYAAGQIYFAFLKQRKNFKMTQAKLTRISLEINFVNHALPSGGASGLAYLVWRLKDMGVTAGQISFIHILRYAICALANTAQTFIAIAIVLFAGCVLPGKHWTLGLAALIALGIQLLILTVCLIVRKQKRIDWLSDKATKFVNGIMRKISRGKKRKILKEDTVSKFFGDLRGDYLHMKQNKRILWKPAVWGAFYSFLELATYWVVACSLGHPEILPQIMIAEGVASVVGTVMVTPGGLGGYEGAMVLIMVATGVAPSVAMITVIVTRICVLLGTVLSGWGFYQHALMSREDKFKAESKNENNPQQVYTVTDFQAVCNQILETAFTGVIVEGEVASYKVNQGKYVFFDLKDDGASVGCFMMLFAQRFPLEDGMRVRVRAVPKLTNWGKFSLTVQQVQPVGEGSLKKSFEMLKKKLAGEGLFDTAKKRPLPEKILKIGVISSTQAAGYADFCKILNERWGGLTVLTAHTQVQGMAAADQIIRALKYFNEHGEVDIIAVIRGGGSADDLAVFNDEALVRAIAASKIPVITGIGHEVDESLCDLAADIVASTPSNAAQMLTRDRREVIASIEADVKRINNLLNTKIDELTEVNRTEITRIAQEIYHKIELLGTEVSSQNKILAQLNPETVLARGYALVRGDVVVGQDIEIETDKRFITANVKEIKEK